MEMDMEFLRKLPTPEELKQQFPVSDEIAAAKAERDAEICRIFEGKDDRLLLVIGPCSADHEDAVIDYISRLRKVQDKVQDKIFIIPRIYTNKPRTIGVGYKGMLHQPDPEKETDMLKGQSASCICALCARPVLPVRMRCSIRRITGICPICSHMWRSGRGRWRISSTGSRQAVWESRWG